LVVMRGVRWMCPSNGVPTGGTVGRTARWTVLGSLDSCPKVATTAAEIPAGDFGPTVPLQVR
jgi:hypothetical protein